jgi:ATP-dependent DNA helicase RecG
VRTGGAAGASRLVIGTHALVREACRSAATSCVIGEQRRFGVGSARRSAGAAPDVLLLTATPIPRSLALTLYGDLDVSILRQRPPGRGRVRTAVRTGAERERVLAFIHEECRRGRQAYVVLPVIEETEKADLKAATTMAEQLRERYADLSGLVFEGSRRTTGTAPCAAAWHRPVLVATTVIGGDRRGQCRPSCW